MIRMTTTLADFRPKIRDRRSGGRLGGTWCRPGWSGKHTGRTTEMTTSHEPQRPLYRRVEPGEMAALFDLIFARERVDRPESEFGQAAEWYCTNEDCAVREVEVSAK